MSDGEQPGAERVEERRFGGSIERTLAGQAELEILAVIREAWARTEGIKGTVIAGMLLIYAAVVTATLILGAIFGVENQSVVASTVSQLVVMTIVYPFMAGVFMLGLRRSVGLPVTFQDQFAYYSTLVPIVAVGVLQSAVTTLGFVLLILPGIYLTFALSLAVPLKAERNLPVVDCLMMSIRLVNRKFFEVAVLTLAIALLLVVGILSLIGWIWTIPWTVMIMAIMYRQLAGFTPGGGPGGERPASRPVDASGGSSAAARDPSRMDF